MNSSDMKQPAVGPELDAAVATACGWTSSVFDVGFGKGVHCVLCDEKIPKELNLLGFFEPSTNIIAAFAAAEKFRLFRDPYNKHGPSVITALVENEPHWEVTRMTESYDRDAGYVFTHSGFETLSVGVTPAEAICRAILALARK